MYMRWKFAPLAGALILCLSCLITVEGQTGNRRGARPQSPPVAPVKPVIDDYHGIKVSDPYRYMEKLDDPAVQAWFKAQNEYGRTVLSSIPGREKLLARIEALDQSVPEVSAHQMPGGIFFVQKLLPGENVFKLYKRKGLAGQDVLLLDPEKISLASNAQKKGNNTIWGWATSDDSKYLAVDIIPGGSELDGELHILEIATGRETGDVIPRVGAEAWNPHWLPDNRSFVYGRLQNLPPGAPEAETRQKFRAYLHVVGTDPKKDLAVFGYGVVPSINVEPSLIASIETEPGSRYALGVLNGSVTPNSAYYIAPVNAIGKSNRHWRKVADLADGVTQIVIHGDDLYALTYKDTPRYKVLRTDARNPNLSSAETLALPNECVVESMAPAQDALYVRVLDGGIGRILRVPYGSDPKIERVTLPFDGSVWVQADPRIPGILLVETAWTKGFQIYRYDPSTRQVINTKLQPAGPYDSPNNIESIEVKAKSHDGILVPLSIIYPKGIQRDGSNPTLLEGYGSYGTSYPANFESTRLAWHENGGVYAVCHVRGGGEYGEEWHLAGKGASKPNTWKDFIACAEYLIENKYTSPAHLAGTGTSAGGVLIGRGITERPDLFGAAIDKVGMSDMLRSETTQNGETNIPEFGTTKTEDGFKALYAMSAYDHVEQGSRYPAVLLETGMNDPRVAPWEMAKLTARLQAATSSEKPVLLRVEYAGGHGSMGGTKKQEHETLAEEWSFLLWQLGAPEFQMRAT
jgi:prolyl oligopeptidase